MYFKNPNQFTEWRFSLLSPTGEQVTLPVQGRTITKYALSDMVINTINQFTGEYPGYDKLMREEAKKLGLDFYTYIIKAVEHQNCLRQPDPLAVCWNDGIGDEIHAVAKKIDGLVRVLPKHLRGLAESATKAATYLATGKSSSTLGECWACGGTTIMDPNTDNNLGRAARLNNL